MQTFFLLTLVLLLGGCASRTYQTEELLQDSDGFPSTSSVTNVPFIAQEENHCGPASLGMMLSHEEKKFDLKEITSQMYTPKKEGTFQTDLISSARRQGMMVMPVRSMKSLIKELSAGNPVLVFQNLGLESLPQWHYAVATGYNLKKTQLTLHSGPKKNLKVDLRVFEHSWNLANYWGIVILTPGKLSPSSSELSHVGAAASLEQIQKFDEAERAYMAILLQWPSSLSAHIGMGNIRHAQRRFSEAVVYLTAATIKHPESSVAWHNLAIAQGEARMLKDANVSSLKAISLAQKHQLKTFQESLKPYLP